MLGKRQHYVPSENRILLRSCTLRALTSQTAYSSFSAIRFAYRLLCSFQNKAEKNQVFLMYYFRVSVNSSVRENTVH